MTTDIVTALLLIVVPIAFNLAFFELGRAFDYPNILRKEPDEILRRFAAGGSGLILRWEALLLSALAMLPLAALLAVVARALAGADGRCRSSSARPRRSSRGSGSCAGRSPCPELARRYVAAPEGPAGDATRRRSRSVFATLHRLLGVGIGEHLGYLFTGLWTLLVGASILSTAVLPAGSGSSACRSGSRCSSARSSSSGPNERDGWPLAGHDRPDRVHRLVALADRARDLLLLLRRHRARARPEAWQSLTAERRLRSNSRGNPEEGSVASGAGLIVRNARLHPTTASDSALRDVLVEGDRIAAIRPAGIDPAPTAATSSTPRAASSPRPSSIPHVHMDAVLTVGEPRHNESGTLIEGIQTWAERKPSLTHEDVKRRAREAILLGGRPGHRPDPLARRRLRPVADRARAP